MTFLAALSSPDFADFEGTLPAALQEPSDWEVQSMKLACGDEGDAWGGKGGSDARVRQVGGEGSSIIIGKIAASGFKQGITEKVVVKTSLVETGICATGYDCDPDK